jgi:hypothetical protein
MYQTKYLELSGFFYLFLFSPSLSQITGSLLYYTCTSRKEKLNQLKESSVEDSVATEECQMDVPTRQKWVCV